LGLYQGLYSMSGKKSVEKPDAECFGDWIPEKLGNVISFGNHLLDSFWSITYEEAKDANYSAVDLLFLNDEYCHGRNAFWDLYVFCDVEGRCTADAILTNMQTNAFSMITQVSQAVAIFKQQDWEDMDVEARAYAFNQLGHSISQVLVDIIGFKK